MKIDLKELGKRIKLIRKGQDLTQEMLAEKAGVSQLEGRLCPFIVLHL